MGNRKNKGNKSSIGGMPVYRPKTYKDFEQLNSELHRRRFVPLDALKPGLVRSLTLGDKDPSDKESKEMSASMGCGLWSNGPLKNVAWSFDNRTNSIEQVSDKDGKPLGMGYVKWGPDDVTPSSIPPLAWSLPYTSAPLSYKADLIAGLGPKLMYAFDDDTFCEYKKAGYRILERIETLKKNEQEPDYGGEMAIDPHARPDEDPLKPIGAIKPEDRPDPILRGLGIDFWKDAYREWERTWEGIPETEDENHVPGAREFIEENNLDLHLAQFCQDYVPLEMSYPTVGFHDKGRRGQWKPVVNRIGLLPAHSTRLEKMNEHRFINHVYFSDSLRTKGASGIHTTTSDPENNKFTMYPACMPQRLLTDIRELVKDNQKTAGSRRPMWVVCPTFYPSLNKPYYPQPSWWSVFSSKAFDFASTILYDKYKQRENITSWGKIVYISLDYLDRVIADHGLEGKDDEIQKFVEDLENSMEDFLQHRENHGKMMRQWMWLGQDGKDHHNVEIVDIAETSKDVTTAGKEEMELATNPIFLALQVDPRDVGVPMVSASNGGTALREIRLMKQQILNIHQRLYLNWLQTVTVVFNGWDTHAQWVIKQMTFTTLDRNPTGMVETTAGQGA